ncbi:glycosyltransferase family 1 protein [bacterium]|nr:MAG: glycosyltransferase family 1 protein [bacterium]
MSSVPVVHIITKLEFGGAQQNTLYTVRNLDRIRYRPVLITGPGGYLMPEARRMDVPLYVAQSLAREISPLNDFKAHREIIGILRSVAPGPAIVHTHSSKAGIVGRWAASRYGIPIIIHSIHGFGFTPSQGAVKRSLLRTAERRTSRITDHFIAVSFSNRQDGVKYGFFKEDRCTVIRSGFDLDRFRNASSLGDEFYREQGIPTGSPIVLMVACLKPQKAPLDYVHVARLVADMRPDVHFLLAGDGELRDDLTREVERCGLSDNFHLLGWREDVPELMKTSHVVVLTSLWEGLPRVIPQAKASGRPVVATAVDGSREAVREGEDGYLCSPGDVKGMSERVLTLLNDPDRARIMGEAGSRAVDGFDRDKMVKDQEDLYRRLLDAKGIRVPEEREWAGR